MNPLDSIMAYLLRNQAKMPPVTQNPIIARQGNRIRENVFQRGIRQTPWWNEFVKEYKEEPDLNTKDYDYRAAWFGGIRPERDPYDNNKYHWPSSLPNGKPLKSEDHPTAWKEYFMRKYGVNPDALGLKDELAAQQWEQLRNK